MPHIETMAAVAKTHRPSIERRNHFAVRARIAWLPGYLAVALVAPACVIESNDGGYAPLYASCGATSDCERTADACFTVALAPGDRGRMCSRYCVGDEDCPGDSACFELIGDPSGSRICYARCAGEADCGVGLGCADAVRDSVPIDNICVPL